MRNLNTCKEGGCGCGAVRYRMLEAPLIVHACHCRACQRQTGSWHAVNALIESQEVELVQGELTYCELPTPSGSGQTIARCSQCGVAVWSNYHAFPGGRGDRIRFIRVGTLDHPDDVPPDVHIFDADRNPNAPEPASAPRYKAFYDPIQVWNRASLRRVQALSRPQVEQGQARRQ